MAIWVDADACPNVIKEILFRAAERVQMPLTLVANQNIRVPPSRFIRSFNPRGERYSPSTIREKLTMRDFMDTMRASGVQTGGPDSLSQRDRQQFAAELDKWLLEVKRRTA